MTEKVKQSAAPVTGNDEIDIGRLVATVVEARWWGLGITTAFALCSGLHAICHSDLQCGRAGAN